MNEIGHFIAVTQLGIREAREDYPHIWETVTATFPWADPAMRARIVSLSVGICQHCYSKPSGCKCDVDPGR